MEMSAGVTPTRFASSVAASIEVSFSLRTR